jgi:hypothetical protein
MNTKTSREGNAKLNMNMNAKKTCKGEHKGREYERKEGEQTRNHPANLEPQHSPVPEPEAPQPPLIHPAD